LDSSTTLLILSCYARLLHVFELRVASLRSRLLQSADSAAGTPSLRSRRRFTVSSPSSSSGTSSLSRPDLPVFNIGRFSLSTTPCMNIGLMLQLIPHMIARVHDALQPYALAMTASPSAAKVWGCSTRRRHGLSTLAAESPTLAISEMALAEVDMREKNLMAACHQAFSR
jgi:hypothetical protein